MKPHTRLSLGALLLLTACRAPLQVKPGSALPLASFSRSRVEVAVALIVDEDSQAWLQAVFTPEEGCHLYGMEVPLQGVDGLGRPTLLEIVPGGRLQDQGLLSESPAAVPQDGMEDLLIYPPGAVTLRLPVLLPEGKGWFDEQVWITFMACRQGVCFTPVVREPLSIRVPGRDEVRKP